ncbi:MAG TPA: AraC family transcriptional regulator [Chitinophagaceae bacterium]|jgi:AraC-like DNA-binding protein
MKLFIKDIAALRTDSEVKTIVENFGLQPLSVDIGEVELKETLSRQKYDALKDILRQHGFELLSDRERILTEKIRNVIIEMIHFSDELPIVKYSNYISGKLKVNYTHLSKIFSRVKKTTIEHFIILNKIERVKQLLLYNELSLSEIAMKLHYSSTAHLSAQFKKITGFTPSVFKKSEYKTLIPVEFL